MGAEQFPFKVNMEVHNIRENIKGRLQYKGL
jgi:hypothetical protein